MMLTSATTVAASRVVVAPRASAAKKASRAQFGAVRGFDPLRYVSSRDSILDAGFPRRGGWTMTTSGADGPR
jgi:hypothetical protein